MNFRREFINKIFRKSEEFVEIIQRWKDYVSDYHYIKPLPLDQVNNLKNITMEMLPPGYDYGTL